MLDVISLEDFPIYSGIGSADRLSFKENRPEPDKQRPVNNEGMTEYPSNITGTEHSIIGLCVINVFHGVV